VADYREAPDRSLQLWALPPGQSPRSLGVLQPGTSLRWSARENEITYATSLAVSLEPAGGVPGHSGPTGPILFKGDLIRQTM
jgi:anti-sigma-K factor RskA